MNIIEILTSLSTNTKYLKWYISLVSCKWNNVGYTEKHHILPKSLGGDNSKINIVRIPARVHFICHKLLVRMVVHSKHRKAMVFALNMMAKANNKNQHRYQISSREYEKIRAQVAEVTSGKNSSSYGKVPWNKGVTHSPETRAKLSKANIDYWAGRPTKSKLPPVEKRPKHTTCCYCGKCCVNVNHDRWHGENCLLAPNGKENRAKWINPGIGMKRSEQTRINIGNSKRGVKHTEESKQKISDTLKGRPVAPDVLKARFGRKASAETCKKISDALTGKPKSDEHKHSLSLSRKAKYARDKDKDDTMP